MIIIQDYDKGFGNAGRDLIGILSIWQRCTNLEVWWNQSKTNELDKSTEMIFSRPKINLATLRTADLIINSELINQYVKIYFRNLEIIWQCCINSKPINQQEKLELIDLTTLITNLMN